VAEQGWRRGWKATNQFSTAPTPAAGLEHLDRPQWPGGHAQCHDLAFDNGATGTPPGLTATALQPRRGPTCAPSSCQGDLLLPASACGSQPHDQRSTPAPRTVFAAGLICARQHHRFPPTRWLPSWNSIRNNNLAQTPAVRTTPRGRQDANAFVGTISTANAPINTGAGASTAGLARARHRSHNSGRF